MVVDDTSTGFCAQWTKLILIFKSIRKFNLLSRSSVGHKVSCLDCGVLHWDDTARFYKIRLKEQKKFSTSATYNHIHDDILAYDQVKLRLKIKECHSQKESALFLQIHAGKSKKLLDKCLLELPRFLSKWPFPRRITSGNNQDVINSQFFVKY